MAILAKKFPLSTVLFILPQALRGPKGLQGLQGRSGGPAAECADTRPCASMAQKLLLDREVRDFFTIFSQLRDILIF